MKRNREKNSRTQESKTRQKTKNSVGETLFGLVFLKSDRGWRNVGKSITALSSLLNVRTQGRATQSLSLSLISANALFASSPYYWYQQHERFRIFLIPALSSIKISFGVWKDKRKITFWNDDALFSEDDDDDDTTPTAELLHKKQQKDKKRQKRERSFKLQNKSYHFCYE